MTKYEGLSDDDNKLFKFTIGLARHEYFDAMLLLSQMKYPLEKHKYQSLCKLCKEYLIPYIWNGMENAEKAVLKTLFKPYTTDLRKLFSKYNSIDSSDDADDTLLGLDEWKTLCHDILIRGAEKTAFNKGGKPTDSDIISSFELSKQENNLELTYKGFENALKNLSIKLYKKKPKAKYNTNMTTNDKLS